MTVEKAYHPAAEIFPLLAGEDFERLVEDIRANGLREPVWLHPDGRILDGRNRDRACRRLGIAAEYRNWDGKGSEVSFVLSLNLQRRHLNESQRAMVAARVADLPRGVKKADAPFGASQVDAAEALNVARRSVQRAARVQSEGVEELQVVVDEGNVPVSVAAKIATLPQSEQRKAVKRINAGERPSKITREFVPTVRAPAEAPDLEKWLSDIILDIRDCVTRWPDDRLVIAEHLGKAVAEIQGRVTLE